MAFVVVFGLAGLGAQNKEQGRLEECGVVMEEVLNVSDNIPQELLDKAECVVVIPSTMKVAVGIGGSYGRGATVCRSGKAFDGPWLAPAMYTLQGGSIGFQLGGESNDVVLLIMNRRGVNALLSTSVKLGGNASAVAGPKGRTIEASTDASMRAETLSYSRSRGLFAGVALSGASLRPDNDASAEIYGRKLTARQIVTGTSVTVPESGRHLVAVPDLTAFLRFEPPTTGVVRDVHDEVPVILRQAILAAEDKRFFSHVGVDYRALPRVVQKAAPRSFSEWRKGGGVGLLLPQGSSKRCA